MMVTGYKLYKLLVGTFYPNCINCVHYKHGSGVCKLYGDILSARTDTLKCGIQGKYFLKETSVKENVEHENLLLKINRTC